MKAQRREEEDQIGLAQNVPNHTAQYTSTSFGKNSDLGYWMIVSKRNKWNIKAKGGENGNGENRISWDINRFRVLNGAIEMESVKGIAYDPSNAIHITHKVLDFAFSAHNNKNLKREKMDKKSNDLVNTQTTQPMNTNVASERTSASVRILKKPT